MEPRLFIPPNCRTLSRVQNRHSASRPTISLTGRKTAWWSVPPNFCKTGKLYCTPTTAFFASKWPCSISRKCQKTALLTASLAWETNGNTPPSTPSVSAVCLTAYTNCKSRRKTLGGIGLLTTCTSLSPCCGRFICRPGLSWWLLLRCFRALYCFIKCAPGS